MAGCTVITEFNEQRMQLRSCIQQQAVRTKGMTMFSLETMQSHMSHEVLSI